tara:strand:+ start:980 stop:1081 length:102 start_codon:yes stop_codon:yes gene_type:complete
MKKFPEFNQGDAAFTVACVIIALTLLAISEGLL